jgi:hypothetical protein
MGLVMLVGYVLAVRRGAGQDGRSAEEQETGEDFVEYGSESEQTHGDLGERAGGAQPDHERR